MGLTCKQMETLHNAKGGGTWFTEKYLKFLGILQIYPCNYRNVFITRDYLVKNHIHFDGYSIWHFDLTDCKPHLISSRGKYSSLKSAEIAATEQAKHYDWCITKNITNIRRWIVPPDVAHLIDVVE